MEELEEALEERSAWLACVPVMPVFEPLHGSERFQNIVNAIRLPHHGAIA